MKKLPSLQIGVADFLVKRNRLFSLVRYALFGIIWLLLFELQAYEDQLPYKILNTSQGTVAYIDTGGSGFPVVLIHGNSCSSEVFKKQIAAFRTRYRLIAVDLPGHGRSSRPNNPDVAYTIPGYAKVLDDVVHHLDVGPFAIVGFSLGGNIALQWTQIAQDRIQAIMMISSAPMKYSTEAFLAYPPYEGSFAGHPDQLTESQATQYMGTCGFQVSDPSVYFMVKDAMRTDGQARAKMVASVLAGNGTDETEIIHHLTIPLAVVVGREDSALGLDYLTRLPYRNLWRGNVEFIEKAKHALPLHQSDQIHSLLEMFLADLP